MRIQYTLSKNDLLEAQQAQLGWSGRALPFIGGLVILSGIYTLAQNARQFGPSIGAIGVGAGLAFGFRMLVSYSYRRDKRLHDQFVAIPSDEGIEISSSTVSSKFAWNSFTKQVETKSLFLLFQGPACVNIIPKTCLSTADADVFRKLVREKVERGSQMDRKPISLKTWIFIAVVSIALVLLLIIIRNTLRQASSQPVGQTQSTNPGSRGC